jgi:hypothetical protein
MTKFITLFLGVMFCISVHAQNTRSQDAAINYTIDGVDYTNATNAPSQINFDSPDTSVSKYVNPSYFWHSTTNALKARTISRLNLNQFNIGISYDKTLYTLTAVTLKYRFRPATEIVTAGTTPYSGSVVLSVGYVGPANFDYTSWSNYNIGYGTNIIGALNNGQDYVMDLYIETVATKANPSVPNFVISDDYQKLGHNIITPFSIPFTKAASLSQPGIQLNGKISYDIDGIPFYDASQNQYEAPFTSIDTSANAWWNYKISDLKKDTIGTLMYTGNKFNFEYDDTKFDVTKIDIYYKVKKVGDPLINEGFKLAGSATSVFSAPIIPANATRSRSQTFETTGFKLDLLANLQDTTNYILEVYYKPIYTVVGGTAHVFELAPWAQGFGRSALAPFGIPFRTGVRAAGFRAKFSYIKNTTPFLSSEISASVEPYNTGFDSFDSTAVTLTAQTGYYNRNPEYNFANAALQNSTLDSLFINDIRTSVVLDTTLGKVTALKAFYKVRKSTDPVSFGTYTQLGYDLINYGSYEAPYYGGNGVRVTEFGTPVVGFKIKNYGVLPNTDAILDTLQNSTTYALDVYFTAVQGQVLASGRSTARITAIQEGKRQQFGYSKQFPFTLLFSTSGTVLSINNFSIRAVSNNIGNNIVWSNATNSSIFNLQRSVDGINFNTIYTGSNKQYTDTYASISGIYYYRVFVTNNNGRNEYSSVVTVNKKLSNDVRIFPNPITSEATLQVVVKENMDAYLDIKTITGETINNSLVTLGAGTNSISIKALANVSAGTYIIRLVSGNQILALQKVIKQ